MAKKTQLISFDKSLARRLKVAREWVGFSQAQLAAKAKLPPSSISNFESGNREPSFSSLRAICYAINISPDYFFGFSDNVHRGIKSEVVEKLERLGERFDFVMDVIDFCLEKEGAE